MKREAPPARRLEGVCGHYSSAALRRFTCRSRRQKGADGLNAKQADYLVRTDYRVLVVGIIPTPHLKVDGWPHRDCGLAIVRHRHRVLWMSEKKSSMGGPPVHVEGLNGPRF